MRCGDVVLRTAAKTQTTTPEWLQEFKFGVRKPLGDIITFKVFAFSDVKDELLGETFLTIADLPADETVREESAYWRCSEWWLTGSVLNVLCDFVFFCRLS